VKRILLFALCVSVTGCGLIQSLLGDGSSGQGGSTGTGDTGPQGIDCGTDPETSVTLCLGTSLCPGMLIDTEAYPACGFRMNGGVLDVECSCNGMLCPLGAVGSCDDLKTAFANSNEGTICAQVSAGTCTQGTPMATSSSAATGGGTCDVACRDECAGDQTCIQSCGC
jgi:hypothetical protein